MAVYTGVQARMAYGNVNVTAPYTPSGADVAAGEVVVVGDLAGIATQKILDGELGALNFQGGVYQCVGDAAIAVGKRVWWDNTNNKVTETRGTNKLFGYTMSACSADMGTCDVMHVTGTDELV